MLSFLELVLGGIRAMLLILKAMGLLFESLGYGFSLHKMQLANSHESFLKNNISTDGQIKPFPSAGKDVLQIFKKGLFSALDS